MKMWESADEGGGHPRPAPAAFMDDAGRRFAGVTSPAMSDATGCPPLRARVSRFAEQGQLRVRVGPAFPGR